jgi:hypothetical protein
VLVNGQLARGVGRFWLCDAALGEWDRAQSDESEAQARLTRLPDDPTIDHPSLDFSFPEDAVSWIVAAPRVLPLSILV